MKYYIFSFLLFFILVGCASRQYYEPEDSAFFTNENIVQNDTYIKSYNAYGATLDSNEILTKDGILTTKLPENYSFLNYSDDSIIATDNQDKIIIIGENNQTINLKKNAVAASKKDDIVCLVFSDNSIAAYNIKTEQYTFRSYQQHSYVNDTRVASPLILKNIILFPTLDGKVIIVDRNTFKTIRTINVDPNNQVNNIILLDTLQNNLIVATQNKILSIQNQNQKAHDFFIQNYFIKDDFIYIAKLDGTISKYDSQLNELNSKKFKFAKFLTLSVDKDETINALELGGYLVKINKDFTQTDVSRFILKDDEKMFAMNDRIYFDNKILYLNK